MTTPRHAFAVAVLAVLTLASGCIHYPRKREAGHADRERAEQGGSSGQGDGHSHSH